MLNNRGQLQEYVNKSVEDNKKFENILYNYILDKYDIKIIKHNNPFKAYDFTYGLNKIEYKGLYYTLDKSDQKQAIQNKNNNIIIKDVIISKSKIAYYKIRQMKNPNLKFYLIYGFYNVIKGEVKNINYRYLDISNLDNIILNNQVMIYEKSKHYKIKIGDLLKLPDNNPFN